MSRKISLCLAVALSVCSTALANPVFMIDVDTTDNTNGVGAIRLDIFGCDGRQRCQCYG